MIESLVNAPVGRLSELATESAAVLALALVAVVVIAALWTTIREFFERRLYRPLEPGDGTPLSDEDRERFERALAAALPEETVDGHFAHYTDVVFAKERLKELKALNPQSEEEIDQVNKLAEELAFCTSRHYLLWENGGLGKLVIILAFVLGGICLAKWPNFSVLILGPLVAYLLLGRTPAFVAMNPSWVDGLMTKVTGIGLAVTAAMLPAAFSYSETQWVRRDTNEVVHKETEWTGFLAVVFAVVMAVVSVSLLAIRIVMLGLRNFILYR